VFTRSYPHPDGTNRFLDLTAAIIPWDTGQAILVTARDVTERKAIEDRLAENYSSRSKKAMTISCRSSTCSNSES